MVVVSADIACQDTAATIHREVEWRALQKKAGAKGAVASPSFWEGGAWGF